MKRQKLASVSALTRRMWALVESGYSAIVAGGSMHEDCVDDNVEEESGRLCPLC